MRYMEKLSETNSDFYLLHYSMMPNSQLHGRKWQLELNGYSTKRFNYRTQFQRSLLTAE